MRLRAPLLLSHLISVVRRHWYPSQRDSLTNLHTAAAWSATRLLSTKPARGRAWCRKPRRKTASPMPSGPLSGLERIVLRTVLLLQERPPAGIQSMAWHRQRGERSASIGIPNMKTPPVTSLGRLTRVIAGAWHRGMDFWI